ncbi:MAG TPA: ATP-grasp domain-containing protein [Methanoregulaceae archaeon]|nr:ATP-grasp domain-containing protein [Methanoregulaceae archaeon]
MICIVPKPTDTPDDHSTAAVAREIARLGGHYKCLDLDNIDPFGTEIDGNLIWICGLKQDLHQFEVVNALSLKNLVVNSPQAIFTCASKVMTSALLEKNQINTPLTLFTASKTIAENFILSQGKVVTKPVYGYDGLDIRLISSAMELAEPPYYLQEYIPNDRDFRVFVIDGKPEGAIARVSQGLAHNIHQGGTGMPVEIDEDMRNIAGAAADAVGVEYGGVDLLRTPGGYCVLEVNGTPNWHCMAAPIPRLMASYLLEREQTLRC